MLDTNLAIIYYLIKEGGNQASKDLLRLIREQLDNHIYTTYDEMLIMREVVKAFGCNDIETLTTILKSLIKFRNRKMSAILPFRYSRLTYRLPASITNGRSAVRRKLGEKLLNNLKYLIPRRHREPIIGDIMEDCHELRLLGKREVRILVHVLWQFAIGLILLCPAAILNFFKHKIAPPKN